ncbi:MAG: hypothetical protein R2909_16335 [Gemmatimonadales bacterium]
MSGSGLGRFLGAYLVTVLVETPILALGLARRHRLGDRIAYGLWLSAATLPIVWFVLPPLFASRARYLAVAESFAPLAEILLFWVGCRAARVDPRPTLGRDAAAIVAANLASFGVGLLLF